MRPSISFVWLLALPAVQALVHADGTGKLPALGWNSWNEFACAIDETKVITAANKMVSLGLKDAGYQYVNIDDCWSVKSGRDSATGRIVPDPIKFPNGIVGVVDKIHALGLKAGIYSSAGTKTCAGYPASINKEHIDAATFAAWGIDYLKYDNCNIPANWTDKYDACILDFSTGSNGTCQTTLKTAPAGYDWSTSNSAHRYKNMGDALLAQNRTIQYSMCIWGYAAVQLWGNGTGNSWRMSNDISATWDRILKILNDNSFMLNSVNFWGHNDADMLEVGNGKLTAAQCRTHFAFWAAMKSPLIIGTALDKLSTSNVNILKNKYLLAFNQDPVYGGPATPYKWGTNPDWTFSSTNPAEYWSGRSSNGTLVMALNTQAVNVTKQISWSEVPHLETDVSSSSAFYVTDVWSGSSLGCVEKGIAANVAGYDTAAYIVGEACSP